MSGSREGLNFTPETKAERLTLQEGRCAETGEKGRLQGHHKIPIWFFHKYMKDTPENREYIRSGGNLLYLILEAHIISDEFAKENINLLIDVIIYVLGKEALK
jgi:hypothetical protein